MSNSPAVSSSALPPHLAAWRSLVSRSIAAWDDIVGDDETIRKDIPRYILEKCHSLDDFLVESGNPYTFWFFQRREAFMSQKTMKKWSRDDLDDYVILPAADGFVTRLNSFFVSHFWRTKDNPDPDGEYLRLHQAKLEPQEWSYIWVDWTCMPQSPRSSPEETYFLRCLGTISSIIRNCGFIYFYPPFEPRLWILYEVTEYVLTCTEDIGLTPDIEPFLQHMNEMVETCVQATLVKHGYRCSYDRDRQFLTSWLELLVLLRRHIDIDMLRTIMDHVTRYHSLHTQTYPGVVLQRFEGTLVVNGKTHTFTPFPQWSDGKYS